MDNNPKPTSSEQAAWHAGLDEGRTQKQRQPAAPGEAVKAFREYLRVHPVGAQLSGIEKDEMALELARIALDFQREAV